VTNMLHTSKCDQRRPRSMHARTHAITLQVAEARGCAAEAASDGVAADDSLRGRRRGRSIALQA
jgi:hypothetical protein